MAEKTAIEWCDHTFNPWRGCTKVSAGCANCYADALSKRNPQTLGIWGPDGTRVVASEQAWKDVIAWDRKAASGECPSCNGGRKVKTHESGYGYEPCATCDGTCRVKPYRQQVFCASLADVFEDWSGPMMFSGKQPVYVGKDFRASRDRVTRATMDDVRKRLFALIDATPNLDWLLVTKRPENIRRMWPTEEGYREGRDRGPSIRIPRRNVWLLTSVENQEQADKRIPELLKCRDLVPVLGLSCEPLLGRVDLGCVAWPLVNARPIDDFSDGFDALRFDGGIDWVIVGGESGPNARPCNINWVRSIVCQCDAADVACFVKQLGSVPFEVASSLLGAAMKDRKGGDPSEWPGDLQVREFPNTKGL
jgi:protein gp37